jgi:hypothetical protein
MRKMLQAGGRRVIFGALTPAPLPVGEGKMCLFRTEETRGCPHPGVDACNRIAKGCAQEGMRQPNRKGRL